MIELSRLTRSYGPKLAVDRLDLVVPEGELFAFLGPNGAGKTTTIRMLVGLLRPSSGSIKVCGHDVVSQTREANRIVGYIPDEPFLYDKLSGREFLEFIAEMYGFSRPDGAARILAQIEQFELGEFVDGLTETYSHGMKQRLVFAAAMLHSPRVLVLDEPMVGLDPRTAKITKDLLRRKASEGMTVFMSTHTLGVAEEIADRIGIVDRGRLRAVGTLGELQQHAGVQDGSLERLFLEITAPESVNGRESAERGAHAGG